MKDDLKIIEAELIRLGFPDTAEWFGLYESEKQIKILELEKLLYAQNWDSDTFWAITKEIKKLKGDPI